MVIEVHIPDIGDYADVEVIEVAVKEGDVVNVEDTLITLETDKATMDVPSSYAGSIVKMYVAVGDKVSKGSLILSLQVSNGQKAEAQDRLQQAESTGGVAATAVTEAEVASKIVTSQQQAQQVQVASMVETKATAVQNLPSQKDVYAGPGVRRFARELGVDLGKVQGLGRKGRILKNDVQNYVKQALQNLAGGSCGGGLGFELPPMPKVDFQNFGDIEKKPLSRIKKISGACLHRNWIHIPHVTQFDEADITKVEQFRKNQKAEADNHGVKLTPLLFVMKAVVAGLQEFPQFNASLDPQGENLIFKKYFHIGVAIDTPNGLVVPVVRNIEQKDIFQLAKELGELSQKARDGKLTAIDMQGGCFTLSSLGGIGGTAFTPIINAPEVAILGVSKAKIVATFIDGKVEPRLMLPLSLSYDHRVIDGAEAARFISFVVKQLNNYTN